MIDLGHAKREFQIYLKEFDTQDPMIQLKIRHTFSVVDFSQYIAEDLQLKEEQTALANLIALLHDIGRFDQLKTYHSYDDSKTMNHAMHGVELLFGEQRLIERFIADRSYDRMIKCAIANHNKYQIEEGLSGEELLQAQLIRDSDKTDNFKVKEQEPLEAIFGKEVSAIGKERISDEILEQFLQHRQIRREDRKTHMDTWVSFLAFIFDYNFCSGLKLILEQRYIDRLVDRIPYQCPETKLRMEQIRECANAYLKNKVHLHYKM